MATMFPYPAKKPGGCRFSGFPDYANHQDYGEEEVEVNDKDFQFWEKIQEDPDVVTLSRVGMDKQKRCLLAREYFAEVNDDGDGVRYTMNPSLMLKNLCITKVKGTRARM